MEQSILSAVHEQVTTLNNWTTSPKCPD